MAIDRKIKSATLLKVCDVLPIWKRFDPTPDNLSLGDTTVLDSGASYHLVAIEERTRERNIKYYYYYLLYCNCNKKDEDVPWLIRVIRGCFRRKRK